MTEEVKRRLEGIRRGEVPDGYRRTKAGIIPAEWAVRPFGDVFQFIPTNAYARVLMTASEGEIRNVHYGDVLIKYRSIIDCDANDLPFLTDDAKITQSMLLKSGDIIIADTAEDLTAGKAVEIANIGDNKVVSGLHTMACRPVRSLFAPKWLGYYMDSSAYHKQLIPLICGAKVSSISKREIIHTTIAIPPLAEQRKIAGILSAQDSAIALKERLVTQKRRQKQGLMQRLLTGKQRSPGFCGEWTVKKLGDVCALNPKPESAIPPEVTFLGMADISESGEISHQRVVPYDTVRSGYTPFMRGDILLAKITPCFENGKGAHTDQLLTKFGFGSTEFYVLRNNANILGRYLFFHTQSAYFRKKLESEMTGTAGQKRVQASSVASYVILCPPVDEQTKIADILSAADREISLLERDLSEEKRMRKALGQYLLSGLVRVT